MSYILTLRHSLILITSLLLLISVTPSSEFSRSYKKRRKDVIDGNIIYSISKVERSVEMETTVSDTTHSLNTPTYSPSSKRVTTYINIDIDKNIDVPPELHEKLTELSLSQFSNSSNADELSQSSEVMVSSVDISRTKEPMYQPSKSPSTSKQKGSSTFPSLVPSISTSLPSDTPSITPTRYLTINPSHFPSYEPSITPSIVFSAEPSFTPSKSPSQTDSETPSTVSSLLPTIVHSLKPSTTSSLRPSLRPKNVSPPSAESIPLSEQSRFSPTSMPSNTE